MRKFWHGDFGVPVSTATRGGTANTQLENSGWYFGSTTPRYVVDTSTLEGRTVKTLKCTTAGHLYLPTATMGMTPAQAAYGEWKLPFFKGGGSNAVWISFISTTAAASGTAGNNCYLLEVGADESVRLYRYTGVTGASLFNSGASFVAINAWYWIRITRTAAGVFSVWILGGIGSAKPYPAWTLVGTATDNTHTTSSYMVIDNDANDLISLGDVTGNLGISHTSLTI